MKICISPKRKRDDYVSTITNMESGELAHTALSLVKKRKRMCFAREDCTLCLINALCVKNDIPWQTNKPEDYGFSEFSSIIVGIGFALLPAVNSALARVITAVTISMTAPVPISRYSIAT